MNNNKSFSHSKVVTRSFLHDAFAKIQNFFGLDITSYQKMVDNGVKSIMQNIDLSQVDWYRVEVTQLTNGALVILVYGCYL